MHMNSAPHLLAEDRPEFERLLDQALRTANQDPELSALIGQRLGTEQLRSMARGAMAAIVSCAATEYQEFIAAREELRARSAATRPQPVGGGSASGGGSEAGDDHTAPSASATPEGPDAPGAGALAVVAVLAPVLAGIAGFLFLLIGYVMRTVGTGGSAAGQMVTIGWWFGGLTVAAVLVASSGLLVTALRTGREAQDGAPHDPLAEEAERARETWRQALLHRGLLPFLREALINTGAPARRSYTNGSGPPGGTGRTPRLGYSAPGFTSPEQGGDGAPRQGAP
ncbi:hypothetical protein [Streptomyces sp. NPDC049555]|uniref:hypothetical protein n=1 Tax=Streptomyces sp. NPDC049555 TaxID=3154930 RepID=UPI0034438F52